VRYASGCLPRGGWRAGGGVSAATPAPLGGMAAPDGEVSDDDPWEDWQPAEQTALDFILAAEEAKRKAEGGESDAEEDSDDWNPMTQQAAQSDEPDAEDEDDWAPTTQGAADVQESEKEALQSLLKPASRAEPLRAAYETKREAEAAGRMLHEMLRPPTVAEAKAEIPRGPDVDVESIPAPQYRTMSQEEAIALVGRGATVDYHGQHGRTPLHKACEVAYPALVKAICDARGDVETRDNFGETPLLMMAHTGGSSDEDAVALRNRRCETIQMLLANGADVHAVNPRGRGVLHLACTENDHQAIETFIEGMADVNAQDLAGFTPLMWSAGRNNVESVKMLLDYEADMNIKAARGQTAMTFALTNGCSAIADILESHQMILDAEEAKRIKEQGERSGEAEEADGTLQLPKAEWACKRDRPAEVAPYMGRRVYMQAKPDRHSNVYVQDA